MPHTTTTDFSQTHGNPLAFYFQALASYETSASIPSYTKTLEEPKHECEVIQRLSEAYRQFVQD